jgi:hypothetical protein
LLLDDLLGALVPAQNPLPLQAFFLGVAGVIVVRRRQ